MSIPAFFSRPSFRRRTAIPDKWIQPLLKSVEVEKPPEAGLLQREREHLQLRDLLQQFLILSHLPLKISMYLLPVSPFSLLFFLDPLKSISCIPAEKTDRITTDSPIFLT